MPKRTHARPSNPSPSEKAASVLRNVSTSWILSLFNSSFAWSVITWIHVGGAKRTPPRPAQPGISTRCRQSLSVTSRTNVSLCSTVASKISCKFIKNQELIFNSEIWIRKTEIWIPNLKFWILNFEYQILNSKLRIPNLELQILNSEFWILSFEF